MRDKMPDNVQTVSNTLQTQWASFISTPGSSAIFWPTVKPDVARFDAVPQNYVIACYNPASPAAVDDNAQGVWTIIEDIIVDIIVKVGSGTTQNAIDTRENLRQACYSIIHHNETTMSGIAEAHISRETYKVESPEHMRLAMLVKCKYFHIKT
jgi:hypothetical protein